MLSEAKDLLFGATSIHCHRERRGRFELTIAAARHSPSDNYPYAFTNSRNPSPIGGK
jgi:hypothetical protein